MAFLLLAYSQATAEWFSVINNFFRAYRASIGRRDGCRGEKKRRPVAPF
jgi:hypothetical protein